MSTVHSVTSDVPSLKHEAIEDRIDPHQWRVECLDLSTGDVYVALFCGPIAKERALEYADFKNRSID